MKGESSLRASEDMDSKSPRDERRSDSVARELLHRLPDLQRSTAPLIPPPVHVRDPQAVLKRCVKRKEPSLEHLKVREQMIFPGWHTESPLSQQKDLPCRGPEPVHLPPLQNPEKLSKNEVSTPALPRWPFSFKNGARLKTQFYEHSGTKYLLINNQSVISAHEDDFEFLTYEQWEDEYNNHCKLLCIPFFAQYQIWKPFNVWRQNIRTKKISLATKSLKESLLIFSPSLRPALIDIRKMCCQITETGLCHMKKNYTYTLQEFQDTQLKQLQEASSDLEKFQELVKEVTVCASHHYLLEVKPYLDEPNNLLSGINMTFHYNCLIHFIRLVDYLVVTALHSSMLNTMDEILAILKAQVGQTPSHAVIQTWTNDPEAASDPAEEKMEEKKSESETPHFLPAFMSELTLDTFGLTYKPPEENFQEAVADFIEHFQNMMISVKTLTTDPVFDSVINPGEDRVVKKYKNGPCLKSILKNDVHCQSIMHDIKESFRFAFDAVKVYSYTFERFQMFYKENESLDLDALQGQEHGLSFFEKALKLYHHQHKESLGIQQKRHLGLLLVNQRKLKEKLVSSPLRCLEVISQMLTQLAKRKVDAMITEIGEAQFKLQFRPSTKTEWAEFHAFVDEIQERMTELEEEWKTVCKLHNLINMYSISMPPEDLVVFGTLQPSIDSLQVIIDEALEERNSTLGT